MRIKVEMDDDIVKLAALRVMAILETDRLYQEIANTHFFGLEDLMPESCSLDLSQEIADHILVSHHGVSVTVKPWTPFNRWTKAIAYADYANRTIYINTRKTFGVHDRVNTIAHESIHCLGFSHVGNYANNFNESTVPYRTGDIFEKLSREIYGN